MDVCDEWQKEQKLARLLEEIGYDKKFKDGKWNFICNSKVG